MRSIARVATFALMASLWIGSGSRADWSGAVADRQVSYDDDEYARAVQVLYEMGTQTVHLFWTEDAPSVRELHYGRSTDLGATWSCSGSDRIISHMDGNGISPEQCAAAQTASWEDETLIVVWSEGHAAAREVHYGISTDGGITWSSEAVDRILSDPTSEVDTQTPSVACDEAGRIHVVWHQPTPGGGAAEVHYSRSSDIGETWSGLTADRVISFPDGEAAIDPKIVASGSGRLVVVWREKDDEGLPAIHVGISDDGGESWSSETADRVISPNATFITDLAADAVWFDEEIHVVYRATYDTQSPYYYEIFATSSLDNGETFDGESGLVPVSHDEGAGRSASNPDVFYGPTQGAIAVWDEEDDVSGTKEQHISRRSVHWSGAAADEIISFPDGENGYRPSISGSIDQIVVPPREDPLDTFVAWTEFNGSPTDNYEVHISASTLMVNAAPDAPPAGTADLWVAPNPADRSVRIWWRESSSGPVRVEIHDVGGRLVRLYERSKAEGEPMLDWNGRDRQGREVPAGAYFVRLRAGESTQSRTLILAP